MSLSATSVECSRLHLNEIDRMFEIYSASYYDTSRARFDQDFKEKTHCIVLRDADEVIVGFTTLKFYEKNWSGKRIRVIFSGDTIIDREHWGSQQLAFAWMRLTGEIWQEQPEIPLYWFLICKGHRTYRYLGAMALSYAPRASTVTAPGVQALMDHLAIDRFGEAYDPKTGILSFEEPQGRLTTELAQVPAPHLRLENVLYFLEKNPRYAAGDELVCLCELHPDNLRPMALRLFSAARYLPC
ncbi:hypothetical protein ACIOYV_23675 [Pseudomonas sp. NPDC087342]|uniref:hypothetical protein n=1 Tax=Pseudomonas sp. NPDC087342 TaxID=3364437 RepID=UPI0038246BF9